MQASTGLRNPRPGGDSSASYRTLWNRVLRRRYAVLLGDGVAERNGANNLYVGPMPQDIHENFLSIAVRDFQLQTAVRQRGRPLLGVPFLAGNPPRSFGIEE